MGETTDQIERQIERNRSQLEVDIIELKQRAHSAMDWRWQVEQHPGAMIAAAFGGGILLSALFNGLRGPRVAYVNKPADNATENGDASYQYVPASAPPPAASAPAPKAASPVRDKVNVFRDALMGLAFGRAIGFVEELLPGFSSELERAAKTAHMNESR